MSKPKKPKAAIKVGLDHRGEFDEVWFDNANVHIERMNTRGFWIGIDLPDGRRFHVNTGIDGNLWYFNLLQDGSEFHRVQRPACHREHSKPAKKGRV